MFGRRLGSCTFSWHSLVGSFSEEHPPASSWNLSENMHRARSQGVNRVGRSHWQLDIYRIEESLSCGSMSNTIMVHCQYNPNTSSQAALRTLQGVQTKMAGRSRKQQAMLPGTEHHSWSKLTILSCITQFASDLWYIVLIRLVLSRTAHSVLWRPGAAPVPRDHCRCM